MREPFPKARVYVTTLLVIEIILGALIITTTGIYHHILGTYLANTERKMLAGQLFNTYLLGFQVIATYLGSIFMWNSIWMRRCSPNIGLLLSVWIFFTFLITVCACATIWTLYMCATAIHTTAEVSLTKGIDLYYSCPEWKLLWDGLQFYRECCGVNGYKDWMKASWMPSDALGSDGMSEPCGRSTALAPYACCKHSCNACFENYIPRFANTGIPFLNLSQINTDGCLPLFEASMWECIDLLIIFVACSIVIDFAMCCLTKVIITQQRSQGGCDSYVRDELDDDDDQQQLITVGDSRDDSDMRSVSRDNIKTKIDRRLVTKTNLNHNSMSADRRARSNMILESEAERRASIREDMEQEAMRRASTRSEVEAEAERRSSIRARMEAERMSHIRSQWNGQQRPPLRSEWNRSTDMDQMQRQSANPMRESICAHGIDCSSCTHARNLDSAESRFVH